MKACDYYQKFRCIKFGKVTAGACRNCGQNTTGGTWPNVAVVFTVSAKVTAKNIPRENWPLWAVAVEKIRNDGEIGVGDTVHRQLGRFGVAFKSTMKAMHVPCSCDNRRADWNIMFPYDEPQSLLSEPKK